MTIHIYLIAALILWVIAGGVAGYIKGTEREHVLQSLNKSGLIVLLYLTLFGGIILIYKFYQGLIAWLNQ